MGDDIGWFNIGAYHQGMMAGRTPHLDKLAREGMRFTDYYAEASCTAGRANFITGELPIRTGMTTVGQAGAKVGIPAEACTIATALEAQGYATGQFGKNHLGDRNEYLPTVHGFDEFFGYLYHLDAMEDPAHPNYPQDLLNKVGPRNMVHCWATDVDDPTEMPPGARSASRRSRTPARSIRSAWKPWTMRFATSPSISWTRRRRTASRSSSGSTRRGCTSSRTFRRSMRRLRNAENGWSEEEAGMAQLDDDVGLVMQKLKDMGEDEKHHRRLHHRQRNGDLHLARWGHYALRPVQRDGHGRRFPRALYPALARPCAGRLPAETASFPACDWFSTFLHAAGNPNITRQLLKGVTLGGRTYKNHLDGYDQMDAITGKGPSARHEIFYLGESTLGAVRIDDYKFRFIDQPDGWIGVKARPDVPIITNLRLDPFERLGWPNNGTKEGSQQYFDWFKYQFWRFVFVQQVMGKELQTFLEYPPMQRGASFNLDAIKAEMGKRMEQAEAAAKGPGQ